MRGPENNTSLSIVCQSSYCCPHKNVLGIPRTYLTSSVNPSFASPDLRNRIWREGMGGSSRSRMGKAAA